MCQSNIISRIGCKHSYSSMIFLSLPIFDNIVLRHFCVKLKNNYTFFVTIKFNKYCEALRYQNLFFVAVYRTHLIMFRFVNNNLRIIQTIYCL